MELQYRTRAPPINAPSWNGAGLTDQEGGAQELALGVDDALIGEGVDKSLRKIPRADVAELAVQSLQLPDASNRSVDVTAKGEGFGTPTKDFRKLFVDMPHNCDYSVVSRPATM